MRNRCDFKHFAIPLGLMFSLLFTICYFWGYTNSEPAVQDLHLNLLKLSILGFTGMNGLSFFLGLMQSFIWGLIIAGLFFVFYRSCPCDGCGSCGNCGSCPSCGGVSCSSHGECGCDCDSCGEGECCADEELKEQKKS